MFDLLSLIYKIPIVVLIFSGILFILIWGFLAYKIGKDDRRYEKWRSVNLVLSVFAVAAILMATCLFRDNGIRAVRIIPFYTLSMAKTWPDIYNQFVLNIILFIPLGAFMPFVFDGRFKHPVLCTLVSALSLSVIIEIIQYIFALGYSETDDLLSNTLGAAIGCLSFVVFAWVRKKRMKEK